MTWDTATQADGLPMWAGTDSVFDVTQKAENLHGAKMGCAALGGMALVVFVATKFDGRDIFDNLLLYVLFLVGVPTGLLLYLRKPKTPLRSFDSRGWTLQSSPSGFVYSAETSYYGFLEQEKWHVAFDNIASVEVSPTNKWQAGRKYGRSADAGRPISDNEWQTFLFLNDGRRAVVLTAHNQRESCVTLAASIRQFLDSRNPKPSPSAAPPAPRAGRDL